MSRLVSHHLLSGLSTVGIGSGLLEVDSTPTATVNVAYQQFVCQHKELVDITPLQHYPYLQRIDLAHNSLDSLSVLSSCTSLRDLTVSHNRLSELFDFEPAKCLRRCDYSHNHLTSLGTNFQHQKYLTDLDVSVNRLQSIDGIAALTKLLRFNVARNELTSLQPLTCARLKVLDASGNFIKDASTIAGELKELTELHLDSNQMTSLEGLEALESLRILTLADNSLTSLDEVARLAGLQQLVELDLRNNPVTSEDSYRLRLLHILPGLEKLDGTPVDVAEVVAAHNAHGADQSMRSAIARLYLPNDEETKAKDGVRPIESIQNATTKASTNPSGVTLAEEEFWALLSERGFIKEWKEWIRIAKDRLVSHPSLSADGVDDGMVLLPRLDLTGIPLGEAGLWAVSEILRVKQIDLLDLSHALHPSRWSNRLSDSWGLRAILASLDQQSNLRTLRLANCHIGREGGILIARYLRTEGARSLRSLHLESNQLGANLTAIVDGAIEIVESAVGLRHILAALARSDTTPELELIDLSRNMIDQQGAKALGDYIAGREQANKNKSKLIVQGEFEEDEEDAVIAPRPPSVQSIILDYNPLSDAGVSSIASALRVNSNLTFLSLRGDADRSFGERGLIDLSISVSRYNRSIRKLDLSGNRSLFNTLTGAKAFAEVLHVATNGVNEAGDVEELILEDTGMDDAALTMIAQALARNQSIRVLDLSRNTAIGDVGLDALFAALRDHTGAVEVLRIGRIHLGQKSALRAAEWLDRNQTIRQLYTTDRVPLDAGNSSAFVHSEVSSYGIVARSGVGVGEEASLNQDDPTPPPNDHLSELVLATLSSALVGARMRGLSSIGFQSLGPHLPTVLEHLTQISDDEQDDAVVVSSSGRLDDLDLSNNHWTRAAFESLIRVVEVQNRLTSLTLRHSTFEADEFDLDAMIELFHRLFTAVLTVGSISTINLSGSALNVGALTGIGRAFQSTNDGLNATLTSLDLSRCGLDAFASEEEESSFLQAFALDGNGLSTLILRGNEFNSTDLTALALTLDANWSMRTIDLGEITIRGGEESLALLRTLITHAVSHGLQSLTLPSLKHSSPQQRDAIVAAIGDGWRDGVAKATQFVTDQERTYDSVLHTLALDIGAAFDHLTWQQKQGLLESIRPLAQLTTPPEEQSFRLVQLQAAGKPIRVNTQPTCGVDLIENALAARLACQRM